MARAPHPPPKLFGWRTVATSMLVGFLVNVVVAWGLAVWAQVDAHRPDFGASGQPLVWPLRGLPGQPEAPDTVLSAEWPWWRGQTFVVRTNGNPQDDGYFMSSVRAGMPVRSLEWVAAGKARAGAQERFWNMPTGLKTNSRGLFGAVPGARLPLRPILPGFIVNTLFYAGLALAAVAVPRSLRRRRRAKRGRCIACGYEVGGIAVCPECGVASSPRRGAGV